MVQSTLLFNAGTGQVKLLRSKEESHDYRYFPDPDLPPLVLTQGVVEEQRRRLSPSCRRPSAIGWLGRTACRPTTRACSPATA